MKNKPKCSKWHSNDVMPVEFKDCIFVIANTTTSGYTLGFRDLDMIYAMNGDVVSESALVERWCYIDLD